MRRYVAGLCTVGLVGAAVSVAAAPVDASTAAPAPSAFVCTPGTWVQQPVHLIAGQSVGILQAAAVATPSLAWAVGFSENSSSFASLIERWSGGSSWSEVGTGGKKVELNDVAAFGANSAFAVGTSMSGTSAEQPLVTHWNGSTWTRTILAVPSGGRDGALVAVSGSSSSDVFAVGDYLSNGVHLLIEHWNGSAWSLVTVPSSAKPNADPSDVVSVGPGDMWMDGFAASDISRFWHDNGGTWTLEATPPGDESLAGTSDTNIWMVGVYNSSGTPLLHFNGSSWSSVDNNGNGNIGVDDLAMGASSSTVWSVGYTGETHGPMDAAIAKNGVAQTVPTVAGSLDGIGTGSGLAFGVGSTDQNGLGLPIALASCD